MSETVRLVSDGEELVLSSGEAFRIASKTDADGLGIERPGDVVAAKPIAIRYLGFHEVQGRREYALQARRGEQARRYTVWIELTAFSGRHALLQDGPDICYQKLLHELVGSDLQGCCDGFAVTEDDLAAYRETHFRPVRKKISPGPTTERTPSPAKASASGDGRVT
jgi:hypothetical protein